MQLSSEWLRLVEGPALRLCFLLPPGAYATSLLREVMKTDPAPAPSGGAEEVTEWTDG
jgi:tRNA(Glu) U13 pseudouridine synthase TruD